MQAGCHRIKWNETKQNKSNGRAKYSTYTGMHAHIQSIVHIWMTVPCHMHKRTYTYTNTVCSSAFSLPGPHGPWSHSPDSSFDISVKILPQRPSKVHAHCTGTVINIPASCTSQFFFVQHTYFISHMHYNGEAAINGISNFGFSHWFLFHGHTNILLLLFLSLRFGCSFRNNDGFACIFFIMG